MTHVYRPVDGDESAEVIVLMPRSQTGVIVYSLAEQQQAAEKKGRLTGKQFFQSQEAQVQPPLSPLFPCHKKLCCHTAVQTACLKDAVQSLICCMGFSNSSSKFVTLTGMYCALLLLHQAHQYTIAVNMQRKYIGSCCQTVCLASGHHLIVTPQVEESDPSDFEFEDEQLEGKQALLESDEEELSPDDDDESGAYVLLYTTPTLVCAVHAAFACSVMLCFTI